jgi:hypothetical protein
VYVTLRLLLVAYLQTFKTLRPKCIQIIIITQDPIVVVRFWILFNVEKFLIAAILFTIVHTITVTGSR